LKPIIKNIKTFEIIAAVDPVIERAFNITGQNHSYKDTESMYKNEDIDCVYINTPHHLHKPMIKEAFEEGKNVFCEKPVSTSIDDAREIRALDKKYFNLKLGFNYQYRYDYNCYNLAFAIQNEHIGKPYYANCSIFFNREIDYFQEGTWRAKIETAGGGTLLTQGSHIIDIMIWALGDPISVLGKVDNLKFKNIEVEDIGFGIVEFRNRSYGQINDSMIAKPRKRRINDYVELKIFGEKGSCSYEGPWPLSSIKWNGVNDYKLKECIPNNSDVGECIKAFANWVLYDELFLNTVEESSKVLCLIKALYKSSQNEKKEIVEKL
jgi:UDP-N-acetyl-2-amino-2-deoxyglucuronate dehydrogenase